MNKLSKFFLICGILFLYISSLLGGEASLSIIGAGFLGMWFEYSPK